MTVFRNAEWYEDTETYKDPSTFNFTLPETTDVEFEDVSISLHRGYDRRYMKFDNITREISFDKTKINR